MANIKSAAKRARQSDKRHTRNSTVLSSLKTHQRRLREALAGDDSAEVKTKFQELCAGLDKAVKRGIIHANAASRRKSRFNRLVAAQNAKPAKAESAAAS